MHTFSTFKSRTQRAVKYFSIVYYISSNSNVVHFVLDIHNGWIGSIFMGVAEVLHQQYGSYDYKSTEMKFHYSLLQVQILR